MDRDREKQAIESKLAQCKRLAREFPDDSITAKNIRALADELEQRIRELESK